MMTGCFSQIGKVLVCAILVGFTASFALPAALLWMQGFGPIILVAFLPLIQFIEMNFQRQPKTSAFFWSLVCSFFSAWAIEFGFFFWGVKGIETFLGLQSLSALLMTSFVLLVHSLAILPLFLCYIAARSLSNRLLPIAGACLCMPLVENEAPRLFQYSYGSFLSLSVLTSPFISLGSSGLMTALVFLVPLFLVRTRSLFLFLALLAFFGIDLWSRLLLENNSAQNAQELPLGAGLIKGPELLKSTQKAGFNVLLVQPAIDLSDQVLNSQGLNTLEAAVFEEKRAFRNLTTLEALTREAISASRSELNLIVWPETVVSPLFSLNPKMHQQLESVLSGFNVPILFQYPEAHTKRNNLSQRIQGESITPVLLPTASLAEIWDTKSDLIRASYQKSALMPFGEYLPWRPIWDVLLPRRVLEEMPNESEIPKLGNQEPLALLLKSSNKVVKLAVGICFDGIFPDLARNQVNAGADVIVNLANLEWMGNAASENVYRSIVRLRALETGRPLLFVNNSGGTAAFDASGNFLAKPLEHGLASTSLVSLDLSQSYETGFSRYGYILLYSLAAFGVFMIFSPWASMKLGFSNASRSK